jgi:hypothetical protein
VLGHITNAYSRVAPKIQVEESEGEEVCGEGGGEADVDSVRMGRLR